MYYRLAVLILGMLLFFQSAAHGLADEPTPRPSPEKKRADSKPVKPMLTEFPELKDVSIGTTEEVLVLVLKEKQLRYEVRRDSSTSDLRGGGLSSYSGAREGSWYDLSSLQVLRSDILSPHGVGFTPALWSKEKIQKRAEEPTTVYIVHLPRNKGDALILLHFRYGVCTGLQILS